MQPSAEIDVIVFKEEGRPEWMRPDAEHWVATDRVLSIDLAVALTAGSWWAQNGNERVNGITKEQALLRAVRFSFPTASSVVVQADASNLLPGNRTQGPVQRTEIDASPSTMNPHPQWAARHVGCHGYYNCPNKARCYFCDGPIDNPDKGVQFEEFTNMGIHHVARICNACYQRRAHGGLIV